MFLRGGAQEPKGVFPMKRSKKHKSAEEINAEFARLFESDVKEFSENGAKAFGHILAKNGIDDPQKWLEHKMREDNGDPDFKPYSYNPSIKNLFCGARCLHSTGAIEFSSLSIAKSKYTRAHEMAHKITLTVGRCGFLIYGMVDDEIGRAFNEGATNLIAGKLTDISYLKGGRSYILQTFSVWKVKKQVGADTVFEAAFFDPQILKNKWENLGNSERTYREMIYKFDEDFKSIKKIRFSLYRLIKKVRGKPISLAEEVRIMGNDYLLAKYTKSMKTLERKSAKKFLGSIKKNAKFNENRNIEINL